MTIDPALAATPELLTLAQWLSPAYPVGAFSYSHGLETAVAERRVTGPESLGAWIDTVMRHGSGRSDALMLSAAHKCESREALAEVDAICRAFAPARERLMETDLQGAAFARTTAAIWGLDLGPLCYPVAVGAAARQLGIPREPAAALYLQAFASNIVSAGMRLVPIGQTDGHLLIRDLAPLCQEIARDTAHGDLAELASSAFLADIAAMRHETLTTRIFRT